MDNGGLTPLFPEELASQNGREVYQLYEAYVPKALVDKLVYLSLARIVQHPVQAGYAIEIEFYPVISKYIVPFFKEAIE